MTTDSTIYRFCSRFMSSVARKPSPSLSLFSFKSSSVIIFWAARGHSWAADGKGYLLLLCTTIASSLAVKGYHAQEVSLIQNVNSMILHSLPLLLPCEAMLPLLFYFAKFTGLVQVLL